MSSFGRFTAGIGGVVETLSYTSPTLTLTQSAGTSPLTASIPAGISGSGDINYVPRFIGPNELGNSNIIDFGTGVNILKRTLINSGTINQNTTIFGNKIGISRTSDGAEVVYFSKNTDLGTEGTANINGYNGIQFRTQGAETVKAIITEAGNVGIGTTSPSEELEVYKSQNAITRLLVNNPDTTNTNSRAAINVSSGSVLGEMVAITGLGLYLGTASNNFLSLMTNGSSRLDITTGGNVLIGTITDAGYKLDVNGTARVSGAATFSSSVTADGQVNTNALAGFHVKSGSDTLVSMKYLGGAVIERLSGLTFYVTENGSPQLTIASGGAATFSSNLIVAGSSINVRSSSGLGNYLFFTESTVADRYLIGSPAGSGDLVFRSNANNFSTGTEEMRLTEAGILAINTSTPDASARVQIDSTTQGFLVPRMNEESILAITSPAEGLLVYNLDQQVHCFWDGGSWHKYTHTNM